MKAQIAILLTIPLLLTGCASIMDGGPKAVRINSNPEGAKVTIFNKAGQQVATETTPVTVKLDRSSGFAGEENYKLIFEKEGYYPYEAHVRSGINGWYWGNILVGGIIGCFIDMGTGSCYTLKPGQMNYCLVSSAQPLTPAELKEAELKANPPKKVKVAASPKTGKGI